MTEEITLGDRVTYAEAEEITQRSPRYLRKLVNTGRLSLAGGKRNDPYKTFLSRRELETLALQEYRRGHTGSSG